MAGHAVILGLISFLAGIVQASTGIGYAIIVMSLFPIFLPFHEASALEHAAAFILSGYLLLRLWKHIKWKLLLFAAASGMFFTRIGVGMMLSLPEDMMKRILGGTLLLLALYFICLSDRIHLKANAINGMLAGALAGTAAGMFNIGGPPMAAYFLSISEDKEAYSATLQAYFIICGTVAIAALFKNGSINTDLLPELSATACGAASGAALGYRVFKKLSLKRMKALLYGFMITAGVILLCFGKL